MSSSKGQMLEISIHLGLFYVRRACTKKVVSKKQADIRADPPYSTTQLPDIPMSIRTQALFYPLCTSTALLRWNFA